MFPKKVFKEELEKNKKYNELYQKNKLKELIRRQEILHKKQKDVKVYKEASKIIDIAKPVGKWTKMIIIGSDLIQHFTQLINKNGKQKGFWELFIKTQVLTRGKHKGKGR
ncbi:MAG: hypothetical protein K0T53_03555 [Wolbachia pipientis]|nr:hypothetical protein [Wolbachia pipientis]